MSAGNMGNTITKPAKNIMLLGSNRTFCFLDGFYYSCFVYGFNRMYVDQFYTQSFFFKDFSRFNCFPNKMAACKNRYVISLRKDLRLTYFKMLIFLSKVRPFRPAES